MNSEHPVNIFEILTLRREEEPHDRMLAWLVDPLAAHGINDVAADIIRKLWLIPFDDSVKRVKRQYQLSDQSYPDLGIEFTSALLIIENKVNASALREGQLQLQNHHARVKHPDLKLYHVLLHPDRLNVEGLALSDESFRCLTYSRLAAIVGEAAQRTTGDANVILRHYARYIGDAYGNAAPLGVRMASGTKIARRNATGGWSEEKFLEQVEQISEPRVRERQANLLDLLRSMDAVDVRFDAAGPTNATYKVYAAGTETHVLWVYADGKLYITWKPLRSAGIDDAVPLWKRQWDGSINPNNKNDSFAAGGLTVFDPEEVARKLQVIADFLSSTPASSSLEGGAA